MTHEHIKALDKLIEAVESGGDAIKHNICICIYAAHAFPPESAYGKCTFHEVDRAFHGSLDAAKALQDALLPGWVWKLESYDGFSLEWVGPPSEMLLRKHETDINNPARAWLIAILKAYRAKPEVKPTQNN